MNIQELKGEIERIAEERFTGMAAISMADDVADPMNPNATFDEDEDAVNRRLRDGDRITGRVTWDDGSAVAFDAVVKEDEALVHFGTYQMPM